MTEHMKELVGKLIAEHRLSIEEYEALIAGRDPEAAEALAAEAGEKFDNAFRFLEAAIGPSQELVLFVTEITAGYDTSWFVGEYGCDAYFRNNRELLFDETRSRILEKLRTDKGD